MSSQMWFALNYAAAFDSDPLCSWDFDAHTSSQHPDSHESRWRDLFKDLSKDTGNLVCNVY